MKQAKLWLVCINPLNERREMHEVNDKRLAYVVNTTSGDSRWDINIVFGKARHTRLVLWRSCVLRLRASGVPMWQPSDSTEMSCVLEKSN